MSRNKSLSTLQKTYDDSYLSCSTAVYHESQGNEIEATRHWRNALGQIYDHNANKALPVYATRSDTEKALIDALKQLELQCKERIDLLEALRVSRQEGLVSTAGIGKLTKTSSNNDASAVGRGAIGQGTIPAVTYSELSRPTLPSRPGLTKRSSSGAGSPRAGSSRTTNIPSTPMPDKLTPEILPPQDEQGRSSSPDKRTMRTTLRSGKSTDKPKSRKSSQPASEGPSKAATLAWAAIGSRDKASRAPVPSPASPSPHFTGLRRSSEQQRPSPYQWDSNSRRLVQPREPDFGASSGQSPNGIRRSDELQRSAQLSVSAASSALNHSSAQDSPATEKTVIRPERQAVSRTAPPQGSPAHPPPRSDVRADSATTDDSGDILARRKAKKVAPPLPMRKPVMKSSSEDPRTPTSRGIANGSRPRQRHRVPQPTSSSSEDLAQKGRSPHQQGKKRAEGEPVAVEVKDSSDESMEDDEESDGEASAWKKRKVAIMKDLPPGVDEAAAKQILNDIIVKGDEVRWGDIAGLEVAKNALREAVVYPFLRPDLFMGLREPARGMLLFGPPGTGKTMLARAVATESRSTFFSISASSLTSKFLGESEKLVRALFGLAKALAPSIIFVDEIDSLLSQRSGSGEHEATRRIKTEFLIQWSDLQRAAAGRETSEKDKERGDANRVLVLAATNLPWAIDEAARRRFVRRQYIPLPEPTTRETQLRTLLGQQKHGLTNDDISELVEYTDGFSGSDITALAKDAAMGPLRSLGEALLSMTMNDIRPIALEDFMTSLTSIRPSVSKAGLKEYEDWAKEFGERGG